METVEQMHQDQQIRVKAINRKLEEKRKVIEDSRSDTDSGHSSVPGEVYDIEHQQKPKLKVTRCTADERRRMPAQEPNRACNVIGATKRNHNNTQMDAKDTADLTGAGKGLQVIKRRDVILKRKNMFRRNTIDLNHLDVYKANQQNLHEYGDSNMKFMLNASKSTNYIDKVDDPLASKPFNLNNNSMPDLTKEPKKFATLPNLRVRRPSRIILNENNSSDDDDNNDGDDSEQSIASIKAKVPEFIANSSKPYQEIDITDSKVTNPF